MTTKAKRDWLRNVVEALVDRGLTPADAERLVERAWIDIEDCWRAGDSPRHAAAQFDTSACGVPGQDDGAF